MLEKTRIVVCSEHAVNQIRGLLPPDVELVLADRSLDRGGIDMLSDLLAQMDEEGHDHA
jgi:hypothetical protein